MDIHEEHKHSKNEDYWDNLVAGNTGQYKSFILEQLVNNFYSKKSSRILDVGVGTSEEILKYKDLFHAEKIVCVDYDAKIIERMKSKHQDPFIDWKVADIFNIDETIGTFDFVLLFDMLHEIYSFYGRPNKDIKLPVDHKMGQDFVKKALRIITQLINPQGGLAITDNVVATENKTVRIKLMNDHIVSTVKFFFKNYPSRIMEHNFVADNIVEMNSRDFCILLTQYNKIKNESMARWNVERLEIHQYMTVEEYEEFFNEVGFKVHYVVGTPRETFMEWQNDFEILDGLDKFPNKRITLLAIKE
jgi:SAM-dependent methyltransferase